MLAERPSPPLAVELSSSCTAYVQRALGVALDSTSDTLPLLDHYLERASAEAQKRPEALDLVVRAAGAYFGEMLRQQYDCWWYTEESQDIADWPLRFGPVYLELNPCALAAAAMGLPGAREAEGTEFRIDPDDVEFISAYLANLPPVTEEDFVRLSTRYDTLETVVDQLKARAIARNLGDVFFEDADYEGQ